jgi:alpha-tubulin suppressor-like RCC1 family protein
MERLGNGSEGSRSAPGPVSGTHDWIQADAGDFQACAIDTGHALWCWGNNVLGQLGVASTDEQISVPMRVGTANDWTKVTVGGWGGAFPELDLRLANACGIRAGKLSCWGTNLYGQIGNTNSAPIGTLVQVGTASDWTDVSAGAFSTCGTRARGALYCWGTNLDGEIGDGTNTTQLTPTREATNSTWKQVALGLGAQVCAIRVDGALFCWGNNDTGEVGDGTTTDRNTPTEVGTATDWTAITVGGTGVESFDDHTHEGHTCGIRSGGALYCWGYNGSGQVGDGTMTTRLTPTQISPTTAWLQVSAGSRETCAIDSGRLLICWGSGSTAHTQQGLSAWLAVSVGRDFQLGIRP